MWIFTKFGFFSTVCGKKGGKLNKQTVMVRARLKDHLEALRTRFKRLKRCLIIGTKQTDYPYRMIVPKETWAAVAWDLAEEIDYGNFKSTVLNQEGSSDYERALHRVWRVMFEMQIGEKNFQEKWNLDLPFDRDNV